MIAVLVEIDVKEEALADFMPLMRAQAENSMRLEAGCRQFDVCSAPDAPERVILYEVYDDRAAFDLHLETDHFRDFDAAVTPMIESKSLRILDCL